MSCQIMHDSFPQRGLSDLYVIMADGVVAGYGLVANKHYPGAVNEACDDPSADGDGYKAAPNPEPIYLAVSDLTGIYDACRDGGAKFPEGSPFVVATIILKKCEFWFNEESVPLAWLRAMVYHIANNSHKL